MTKNFDTLLESVLSRLDEAPISHENPEEIVTKAVQTAKASGKGHWTPVVKMGDEAAMADFVRKVVHRVLPDNNNTHNPYINTKEELKAETLKAIEAEMKKSGWAQKFLADRLTNKELLGSVTFEVAANAMQNEQPVTQKEISAALKKKVAEIATPEGQKARIETKAHKPARSASAEEFSLNKEYTLSSEYAKGSLSDSQQEAYNALVDEVGTVGEYTGRDFKMALRGLVKRGGIADSEVDGILSSFVSKGILVPEVKVASEPNEEDFEKGGTGEIETINPEDLGELGGNDAEDLDAWGV